MDFQIFLAQDALSDLERIVAYIATQNPEAAMRLGFDLLDSALTLASLPERGRAGSAFGRPRQHALSFADGTEKTSAGTIAGRRDHVDRVTSA